MALALTAGLSVILALLLAIFIMPSLKSGPHDLPVGLVAPSAVADELPAAVDEASPGAFAFASFATADALAAAVEHREVVGGFVVGDGTLDVYVAGAGSPVISSTVSATGEAIGAQLQLDTTVTDVVPLPAADPSGIGIGGLAFPLVFGGIVPAVAFRAVFPRRLGWAVGGIVGFSLVGGAVTAAVLAFLFGSIATAQFWPVAGAMALGIAALALPLAGLKELLGAKGFTIGAMVMMFLGNPLAGISTSAAWLPAWLGTIGQALPPGSAGTLVRAVAYFGGAGGAGAATILVVWVLAGILLLAASTLRRRRAASA